MDDIVERRLRKHAGDDTSETRGVDLLDLFMESTHDKYTLSGMCVNFLLAGREYMQSIYEHLNEVAYLLLSGEKVIPRRIALPGCFLRCSAPRTRTSAALSWFGKISSRPELTNSSNMAKVAWVPLDT
jgi:hypothetical protein